MDTSKVSPCGLVAGPQVLILKEEEQGARVS